MCITLLDIANLSNFTIDLSFEEGCSIARVGQRIRRSLPIGLRNLLHSTNSHLSERNKLPFVSAISAGSIKREALNENRNESQTRSVVCNNLKKGIDPRVMSLCVFARRLFIRASYNN